MILRRVCLASSIAVGALISTPAVAQDATAARVDRIERELRAVQRKVFGTANPVTPDISAPVQPPMLPGSAGAVTDLAARVGALETQLATMTGEIEQQGNRLRQLEARLNAQPPAPSAPATEQSSTETSKPRAGANRPSSSTSPQPDTARIARVKAVEVPTTGNAAEDSYTYAYRLWDAHLYPEAQTQLQDLMTKYPRFSRMSHARNLLGRAYLDGGQYENAVHTLYENYKADPKGERAADSLMYLALAFGRMNNKKAACTSFSELFSVYGTSMNASLRRQATDERAKAGCT